VTRQRGQIYRQPSGLWAIRYRDARGNRPQLTGYRTKAEARQVLEELLREVRLGALYRPNATLRQLYDAYLEQYDVAPSTVAFLKDNMKPAPASFGDERVGELRVDKIAAWRKSLPEGKRYRSLRSLRQVLAAGVRWKWIEDNSAALVKNPEPKPGEIDPFDSWDEIDAIGEELDEVGAALAVFLCGTGVRPEEAFGGEWRDVDLERRMFRVRRAYAKGRLKDFAKTAGSTRAVPPALASSLRSKRCQASAAGSCSPHWRAAGSTSITGATGSGRRRLRPRGSSTGGSTTCGTRTRRGASRRGSTSSPWRGGWARA
jgi:integrase